MNISGWVLQASLFTIFSLTLGAMAHARNPLDGSYASCKKRVHKVHCKAHCKEKAMRAACELVRSGYTRAQIEQMIATLKKDTSGRHKVLRYFSRKFENAALSALQLKEAAVPGLDPNSSDSFFSDGYQFPGTSQ